MRILLAGMSTMLSGIVTAVLEQSPEITIVGITNESNDLAAQVGSAQADAVVIQVAEPGESGRFRPLLLSFPALKVIAITGDGKGGFLHEMRPWSMQLVELSAATLLAALQAGPGTADALTTASGVWPFRDH
jgi:DNA-binding NarL/FixJ family response regulator